VSSSKTDSQACNTSDLDLVRQIKAGDQEAFRVLVQRHQARLLGLVGRFVGSREDAEDVVQEAFIAAYRQLRRFRGDSSFGTWVSRIALYKALEVVRHQKPPTAARYSSDLTIADEPAATDVGEVREAVARLPEKLRLPVVLRFYEALSGSEIAALLGWKQSTVWTRLYRGLDRLRRDLQGDDLT